MSYQVRIEIVFSTSEQLSDVKEVWDSCSWGWNPDESRMISIFNNRWKNLILYCDDKPVGYVGLISDHNVYALLVDMMIMPEFQKKGLGKKLLEYAVKLCKSEDIKVLKLISSEQGKKLYSSIGFDICPVSSPGMMMKLYEVNNG